MTRAITQRDLDRLTRGELIAEIERLRSALPNRLELQRAIYEIEASREEILLQNESLQSAQHLIEVSRNQFAELYEFAPLAYCILDRNGVVRSINLTGCALLENERTRITGLPLLRHIAARDRRLFLDHLRRCRAGDNPVTTDLRLETARGKQVPAQFFSKPAQEADGICFRTAITDLTERYQAAESRRQLLRELMSAQEAERQRFSRELHDQLGQHVTALSLGLQSLSLQIAGGPLQGQVQQLENLVGQLGREAHDLAARLRPTALDDLGLRAALDQYVEDWSARYGLPVDVEMNSLESRRLPLDLETAVYRIVQEALTNVARHAQAQRVTLTIILHSDHLSAVIEDDGRGFEVEEARNRPSSDRHLGLVGMEQRVSLVNGTFEIESSAQQGTSVLVRIPLHE